MYYEFLLLTINKWSNYYDLYVISLHRIKVVFLSPHHTQFTPWYTHLRYFPKPTQVVLVPRPKHFEGVSCSRHIATGMGIARGLTIWYYPKTWVAIQFYHNIAICWGLICIYCNFFPHFQLQIIFSKWNSASIICFI